MTQIPDSLKKLRDEKADEALVNAIEGGGFIEKPYSRYRFHNGYIAGFDAACAELLPVIEEMRVALKCIYTCEVSVLSGHRAKCREALAAADKILGEK